MSKALLITPLALAACGGSAMSSGPAVVSLQAAGVNPSTISLMAGAQLQFINSDAIDHRIVSSECPELDSPTLAADASFTAMVGAGPKTCGFHDELQPSAASFQGTVIVQSSAGGPDAGYGNPYGP